MRKFPAKILLFGEYTIIGGGSALAIPFDQYQGQWQPASETTLQGFFEYLLELEGVDSDRVQQAVAERWQFGSSIPMGYGLGSSGALSAAAFDTFFQPVKTMVELKAKLSEIESYFHGQSSGLDPLTCYTHQPIRVEAGHISQAKGLTLPPQLHLYDSGIARNGKPFIQYFIDRLQDETDFKKVVASLNQFNEDIIKALIARQDIQALFREISYTQFNHFKHMIPSAVATIWKKGLVEESYYMKLSGAGGGGYFLVWVVDETKTYPDFEKINLKRSYHDIMKIFEFHYWLGRFETKEVFDDFMKETYSAEPEDDDKPISKFVGSQGERFVDHDFMEAYFQPPSEEVPIKVYKDYFGNLFPEVDMAGYNVFIKCSTEEIGQPQSVSNETYTLDYIGIAEYTMAMLSKRAKK